MNKYIKVIVIVLIALFAYGYFANSEEPTFSKQAETNTAKNSLKAEFVMGCTEEGDMSKADCECAFEALDDHYGYEWYKDMGLLNRILSNGYSYEELTAIKQACAVEYEGA